MANEAMRENWALGAAGWVEQESVFDAVFTPVTAALLEAAALGPGQRVLDVGCGSGTLLAAAVTAGAEVTGVDISPGMVERAQQRVPEARVRVADAQTDDVRDDRGPYDRVVSRFGVMFFDDPVGAFAHVREACAPGAQLAFACWRTEEENPMLTLGQDFLASRLDEQPAPAAPFAPGPTAFADPGHTRTVLEEAGWRDVGLAPVDVTYDFTYDGSDGVENRLATLLATSTGRRVRDQLEPRLGPEGWAAAVEELRAHLRTHLVDGGLRLPGAVWLVTAAA
jgi:SAM-dependent methyltransferase